MTTSAQATTDTRTDPRGSGARGMARIAVGIDGFPEGRDAAALGHLLAQATGADLMLVAVHSPALLPAPPELSFISQRQEAQRILREVRATEAPDSRTATASDISVPRALLRVVRRHHCDLLVVGSTREGLEGRVQIGDRTRQLLGQFKCALAVAPRGIHADPPRLCRVGVGYDGGPESEAALALAASIALGAGAELRVQAVVDDRLPPFAWSRVGGILARFGRGRRGRMDQIRKQAAEAARQTPAPVDVAVARGRPSDALLKLSETVDILVIGSRRWGPTKRLLLGSTGEASCTGRVPVLAVPRPSRGDVPGDRSTSGRGHAGPPPCTTPRTGWLLRIQSRIERPPTSAPLLPSEFVPRSRWRSCSTCAAQRRSHPGGCAGMAGLVGLRQPTARARLHHRPAAG